MKIKIRVSKQNVTFFLNGEEKPLKLMFKEILPDDIQVIWKDETSTNLQIYLKVGPHKSKLYDLETISNAFLNASEIKEIFLQYLNDMINWYDNIPVSSVEFEI